MSNGLEDLANHPTVIKVPTSCATVPIKIQEKCNPDIYYQFSWVLGIPSKNQFEKKWSSQNGKKWGKNTEIFIQIGIIFVKRASSILFSEHFHDTCDTFLKSSGFGEFRSKIQNYAFLTKKLRKSIFKLLWIIFFK